jgi:hypothetical protein
MDTHEHLNAPPARRWSRVPLVATGSALAVTVVAVKIGSPHQCENDATMALANHLLVGAAFLQFIALVAAIASRAARVPRAGRVLVAVAVATVLAVPVGLYSVLAVNGLICGF